MRGVASVPKPVFILLSFEGPDRYSRAGGLGTRVTSLAEALAQRGYPTHLFFIGDPDLPGTQVCQRGYLVLHRWGQWISRYHPGGVYDGEEGKVADYTASIPAYVLGHVIAPALAAGRTAVVLAEEWQTAGTVIALDSLLRQSRHGGRHRVVLLWNANNTFGFHRIPWPSLARAATIMTISRYMKLLMARMGYDPVVVPNGIPARLLKPVDPRAVEQVRAAVGRRPLLVKVARWDPDKNWTMAVDALRLLKARLPEAVLVARGGLEPYGAEVLARARRLGLTVRDVTPAGQGVEALAQAMALHAEADVLNVCAHLEEDTLRPLYAAADAVLANSGHEPFGLVGLEAMAAGGIAFVGMTGEDYAQDGWSAVVVQQHRPQELVERLLDLHANPARAARLRRHARQTARRFTWGQVTERLMERVTAQVRLQGPPTDEADLAPAPRTSLAWRIPAYRASAIAG